MSLSPPEFCDRVLPVMFIYWTHVKVSTFFPFFLSPLQRALSLKGAEHRQWPGVGVLQCPHNSRGLPQQHGRDGNRWAHSLRISAGCFRFLDRLLGYCDPQIQWETNPGDRMPAKSPLNPQALLLQSRLLRVYANMASYRRGPFKSTPILLVFPFL